LAWAVTPAARKKASASTTIAIDFFFMNTLLITLGG
jgi:hypothetical protein